MSKCWYCNNELTTGDNPKHFGICNKCYDEMFKSGDTIIRSFTNKIKDLEAKLAKSEKQCRECKHLNKKIELNIKNKLMAENCELQKQLAEKDAERELDNSFWKQECDSLQKTLAEKEQEIESLRENSLSKRIFKEKKGRK